MKRFILIVISKLVLFISPALWNIRRRWAFHLHQRLGSMIIRWHHVYKLDVIKDHRHLTSKK
jgi:hypothetical protein